VDLTYGHSVSRSIIEPQGGRIWAEANDGPGATSSFSIPLSQQASGQQVEVKGGSSRRGTVMLQGPTVTDRLRHRQSDASSK